MGTVHNSINACVGIISQNSLSSLKQAWQLLSWDEAVQQSVQARLHRSQLCFFRSPKYFD
jgi:hypothetical protein